MEGLTGTGLASCLGTKLVALALGTNEAATSGLVRIDSAFSGVVTFTEGGEIDAAAIPVPPGVNVATSGLRRGDVTRAVSSAAALVRFSPLGFGCGTPVWLISCVCEGRFAVGAGAGG